MTQFYKYVQVWVARRVLNQYKNLTEMLSQQRERATDILVAKKNLETTPLKDLRLPVDRVSLFRGRVVLLVDLDRLVRLAGNESRARVVKPHLKDASLGVQ